MKSIMIMASCLKILGMSTFAMDFNSNDDYPFVMDWVDDIDLIDFNCGINNNATNSTTNLDTMNLNNSISSNYKTEENNSVEPISPLTFINLQESMDNNSINPNRDQKRNLNTRTNDNQPQKKIKTNKFNQVFFLKLQEGLNQTKIAIKNMIDEVFNLPPSLQRKRTDKLFEKIFWFFFKINNLSQTLKDKKRKLIDAISIAEKEANEDSIFLTTKPFHSEEIIQLQNIIDDSLQEIKKHHHHTGQLIIPRLCFYFSRPINLLYFQSHHVNDIIKLSTEDTKTISGSAVDFDNLFHQIPRRKIGIKYSGTGIDKRKKFLEKNLFILSGEDIKNHRIGFFYIYKKSKVDPYFLEYKTFSNSEKVLRINLNDKMGKNGHLTLKQIKKNDDLFGIIFSFPNSYNLNHISNLILENICFDESLNNKEISKTESKNGVQLNRRHLILLLEHMWDNKNFSYFKFTHDKKVSKQDRVEENILIIHRLLQYKYRSTNLFLKNSENTSSPIKNFIQTISPLFYPLELSFNVSETEVLNFGEDLNFDKFYEDCSKKNIKEKSYRTPFSVSLEDCFFDDIDDILTHSIPLNEQALKKKIFLDILDQAIEDRSKICDIFKFFIILNRDNIQESLIENRIKSGEKMTFNLFLNIFFEINKMFNNFLQQKNIKSWYNPQEKQLIERFQRAFIYYEWDRIDFVE